MPRTFATATLLFLLQASAGPATAAVYYVNVNATGGDDGSSWQDAFVDLQDALAVAGAGDQVWVAKGTYHPTSGADRTISFEPGPTELFGGFAGGETHVGQRDPVRNETILSGEIGGSTPQDNTYFVVRGGTHIVGVTITGAWAENYEDAMGYLGSGLLEDCDISGNFSYNTSGACCGGEFRRCRFANSSYYEPALVARVLEDCTVHDWTACSGRITRSRFMPGSYLGGAILPTSSTAFIEGSSFEGSHVLSSGIIVNSVFQGSDWAGEGGALEISGGAVVVGCVFRNNRADSGGAIRASGGTIVGGTFTGNSARSGGSVIHSSGETTTIVGSVIWGNQPGAPPFSGGGALDVSYSNVQGGYAGIGNIDADPLFVDVPRGDLRLAAGSPCIDAGDNAAIPPDTSDLDADGDVTEPLPYDLAGGLRFQDDPSMPDTGSGTPPLVDMGAHEAPAAGERADHVSGAGLGPTNPNRVRVHDPDGSPTPVDFFAYGAGSWGVNVASGELDGANRAEILTGPGPGAVYAPNVRGFLRSGTPIAKVAFFAFGTLKYGVNVSAGDLDDDGFDEMLPGAGPGAVFAPHVRGFDWDGGTLRAIGKVNFWAFGTLRYGVDAEGAGVDADAFDEILAGVGPGPPFAPSIRGFDYDGAALAAIASINFWALPTTSYGVDADRGDVDGDGFQEILAAPGPGGSSAHAARFVGFDHDGQVVSPLPGFDATPFPTALYGGRSGGGDIQGQGRDALMAAAGPDPAVPAMVVRLVYDRAQLVAAGEGFEPFPGMPYGATVAGAALGY